MSPSGAFVENRHIQVNVKHECQRTLYNNSVGLVFFGLKKEGGYKKNSDILVTNAYK